MIRIEHLYLSPGHNYFGHHGRAADEHPIVEVPEVECVAGRGLRGDRFFDFKPDYKGQITFFAAEVHDDLCATLREPLFDSDLPLPSPAAYRRNVITRGVDLNSLIGVEFTVQNIRFLGTGECSPCYWMNTAFGPGAEAALKGRGGLRAKILSDGALRVSPPAPVSDA
ncbi:MAG: molybdenum cofactor biosysynthesis protein [Opitutaceae bacterium]|jgi:MOSC domain-containing protein YiiM|nr:molybdenum cofactor biosysynthesis protein [Opitutaceae bacterium]